MQDAFWIAFFASLPATIAAIGALVVSIRGNKKVEEVHKLINSNLTVRIEEAKELGVLQGEKKEKAKQEIIDKAKK